MTLSAAALDCRCAWDVNLEVRSMPLIRIPEPFNHPDIPEIRYPRDAVLDGEIVVCLDTQGRSVFYGLLFRREWPNFFAFDVLSCSRPLLARCRASRSAMRALELSDRAEDSGGLPTHTSGSYRRSFQLERLVVRPQRDSNPCFGLERATSWASGRWGPGERNLMITRDFEAAMSRGVLLIAGAAVTVFVLIPLEIRR